MSTDRDLDPADAPSIPPTFKRSIPDDGDKSITLPPPEHDASLTLPPPEPPTLVPSEARETLLPEGSGEPTPSSLASRARRPLTVKDALAAATSAQQPESPEPQQAPEPELSPSERAVHATVHAVFPEVTVDRVLPVTDRRVFKALWQAHRVRAQADGDHHLAVSASVLLDAAGRVAERDLFAAAVHLGDEPAALWVDTATGTVLALAPTAYLAGL